MAQVVKRLDPIMVARLARLRDILGKIERTAGLARHGKYREEGA
jgi:hypothetical protein